MDNVRADNGVFSGFCITGHSGLCLPMLGLQEVPAESTETKVKC